MDELETNPNTQNAEEDEADIQILQEIINASDIEAEKIEDNVWGLYFKGENTEVINVAIIYAEKLVIFCSYIAETPTLKLERDFLYSLLAFNNEYDIGKFCISEEWLVYRIDIPMELLNPDLVNLSINLVASVVDETYLKVKDDLKAEE